jgi:gliding motility-associated-like protein
MKKIEPLRTLRLTAFTLFCFFSGNAFSQNCPHPVAPVLRTVSVQPETGKTDLKWTLSPSSDIAAYIVYSYSNGDGIPIDTIWNPAATAYTISNTASRYSSVSYVVTAMRIPPCISTFSNVLNTIFAVADIDTCKNKITISWNSYPSVPSAVLNYSVLVSVNGGSYTEAALVNNDVTSYTLNEFTKDADISYVVRANLEGGTFSNSNKACLSTKMQRPPLWINADYATVTPDKNILLSFSIDPSSEITHFLLERKNVLSGSFKEMARPVSVNGSIRITDNKAKVDSVYLYRLSAINNCNNPVTVSNIASNIVLSLERKGNDLNLSWNGYKDWLGTISAYQLYINTGSGFEEKMTIPASDTTLTLGYKEIMYEVTGNEVCFYISASETSNPYNITGQSQSSMVCSVPTEIITVPNTFTPNNDLINDYFRPVLSFTPVNYHLVISDLQGKILFETTDYQVEWDGSQNGNKQAQGVYLWFLKVTTPSSKVLTKTGTLTLVNNTK